MYKAFLIKYGEIGVKGKNRYLFEDALVRQIRYALKKISCSLGLSTPLRLHAARHSWATIAKEHGIPVHIIGECLGHMSEETTRIYLKDLDRSVLDDVNNQIAEIVG